MTGVKLARRASYTFLKDAPLDTTLLIPPFTPETRPLSAPSPYAPSAESPDSPRSEDMLLPGPADPRIAIRRQKGHLVWSARLGGAALIFLGGILMIWRMAVNLPPSDTDIHFPRNFDDLKSQSLVLQQYSDAHFTPVFILFTVVFVFKQAFAIPGSALMNILGGVLYGFWAFPLVSLLTAVGSTFSYILSQLFLGELVLERFARSNLLSLRRKVESNREKGNLFYYLLFLRLFPFSPNWFLNMSSPFVGVPIFPFFMSIFFGLMPYNYICVQAAATLSQLDSFSDILSIGVLLKLISISVLALIPAVYGHRIAGWIRRLGNGRGVDLSDSEEVKIQQA